VRFVGSKLLNVTKTAMEKNVNSLHLFILSSFL
jgi:hypothetical protein